jgi:hypothetical protein
MVRKSYCKIINQIRNNRFKKEKLEFGFSPLRKSMEYPVQSGFNFKSKFNLYPEIQEPCG